jgi:hypothetical protein
MTDRQLDRANVEALATDTLRPIFDHLQREPRGRTNVLEVLNALAVATAVVVIGTADADAAEEWFQTAFAQQLQHGFTGVSDERSDRDH